MRSILRPGGTGSQAFAADDGWYDHEPPLKRKHWLDQKGAFKTIARFVGWILKKLSEQRNEERSGMTFETDVAQGKPARVLASVLQIADCGRDHLRAWASLKNVVDVDTWLADLAMPFFVLTAVAHLEAAAMHAAKLTDTQRDSISVDYLLEIIEGERNGSVLRDDWPRLKEVVAGGRRRLQDIAATVSRIKEKRDRDLAHLDRRHLKGSYESQAIEVADLHEVFDAVDEIARSLAASTSVFSGIGRFSIGCDSVVGSEWIEDLVYFARAGFRDEAVVSPNRRSERIREWDRALRAARSTGPRVIS
jgi:hypothetical protein